MPFIVENINFYMNFHFGIKLPFHAIIIAILISILILTFIILPPVNFPVIRYDLATNPKGNESFAACVGNHNACH